MDRDSQRAFDPFGFGILLLQRIQPRPQGGFEIRLKLCPSNHDETDNQKGEFGRTVEPNTLPGWLGCMGSRQVLNAAKLGLVSLETSLGRASSRGLEYQSFGPFGRPAEKTELARNMVRKSLLGRGLQ